MWLGFGNSGLAGTTEATAMQRAGALSASLPTQEIPFEESPRAREPATRREHLPAVVGTPPRCPTRLPRGGGRHRGADRRRRHPRDRRDPGRAVLVPRYVFDRFARTPPADGTIFRMGATTHLVRSGTRRTVEPCSGVHAVRVPDSNEFLARIPPVS